MWKIRDKEILNPIVVAPMAGISNDAFRQLCFEFGAGLLYSEMVSDKAIYYRNQKTWEMLKGSADVHPMTLQIFGTEESTMLYAAEVLDRQTDCDFIDINMGCPVNKVIKTGAGSAMMKNENQTAELVRKIVERVHKPVTVKMRLGWDRNSMNYLSLGKKLEEAGVSAIALHARTRSQMYEGHSDWSHIRILKENLSIPVIGNGDVKTVEDFIQMKEETNCDAVMIGRGLVGNPFLIKEITNYLNGEENVKVSYEERFRLCRIHAEKLISLKGERQAIAEMRGLAPHYLSGLYGSARYRGQMSQLKTFHDLDDILNEYEAVLKEYETK